MKKLIEWAEGDVAMARKLMLFSTVFTYLIITIAVLVLKAIGKPLVEFEAYYYSFSSVAAIAIGFYTGTSIKRINVKEGEVVSQKQ